MNPKIKSREYHRAYQKWDKLLIEGKADEITIIPGANSEVTFSLSLKKKPKKNNTMILQALEKFPEHLPPLQLIRNEYDARNRL